MSTFNYRLPWLVCLALAACGDSEASSETDAETGEVGTDASASDSESGEAGSETGGATSGDPSDTETGGDMLEWSFEPLYATPNLDDDNSEGRDDWLEAPFADDDDLLTLELPALETGMSARLSLAGDVDVVRLWASATSTKPLLGSGGGQPIVEATVDATGEPVPLVVEFGAYNAVAVLTLEALDDTGAPLASADVTLRSSPVILNHHMLQAEHVWTMDMRSCWAPNGPFIDGYETAIGDRVTLLNGQTYGCDRWLQDELEFATSFDQNGARLDTTIDSIRDRELDDVPEDHFFGPDNAVGTWGAVGQQTTFDSYGNLESTPPVTVDGVEYPYGRVYFGKDGNTGFNGEAAAFLASQEVQAPFEVDSTFLCVGHVDEWISWVPDKDAPKGFRMLYGDIDLGYEALDAMDPGTMLPRFGADHGYPSVSSILNDNALRAYNEDLRDDYLLPQRDRLKAELGLSEEDIIDVPSLFEDVGPCNNGGSGLALIPGMVNLIVANFGPGDSHLIIPDPFLRTSINDQGADPLIAWFEDNMPQEHSLHFIDNWSSYHLLYGEVHCGTNVRRTPVIEDWWNAAEHLLGGS